MKKRFYSVILAFLITSQVFLPVAIPATMGIQIDMLLSQVRTNSQGSISGGLVYFYAAGTSTPKNVYLDINKVTAAANPYTLDSNGTALLYGDGLYRIVITTAAGVTLYDRDNIRYEDLIRGASGTPDNTTYLRGDNSWYKLPRYFSTDAFTDNLTLYGNDLITKGPWVDVRAYLPAGYVTDGSVDYSTQVQATLDNLANGSTLLVPITIGLGGASGWTGIHITGKSNISVIGIGGGGFKVLALPAQDAGGIQAVCTSCAFPAFKVSNSDRITISGLDFNSNSISGYLAPSTVIPALIYFDNVTNSRVTGNKFYGAAEAGLSNLSSVRSSGNFILNNEFTGGAVGLGVGLAVSGWYDNGVVIQGNLFHDIIHSGIQSAFTHSSINSNIFENPNNAINLGPSSHDIAITGNTFRNCASAWRNDISTGATPAYGINFSGNTIDNCGAGMAAAKTSKSIVSNNYMRVSNYGIGADTLYDIVIVGNIIEGIDNTASAGIATAGVANRLTISNNIVYGFSAGRGIWTNNATATSPGYTIVSGNQVFNNKWGMDVYSGDNQVLVNNVMWNNSTIDIVSGMAGQIYGLNNIYSTNWLSSPPIKYFVGTKAFSYGSAAPTDNTIACATGDIVWNTGTDNVLGWKCTAAGAPGTWGAMTVTMP